MTTKQKAFAAVGVYLAVGVVVAATKKRTSADAILPVLGFAFDVLLWPKVLISARNLAEVATASGVTPASPEVKLAEKILANPAPTLPETPTAVPTEIIPDVTA